MQEQPLNETPLADVVSLDRSDRWLDAAWWAVITSGMLVWVGALSTVVYLR